MIIIDMGSGSTCRNSYNEVRRMIDAIADVDGKRKATLKWQLWSKGTEPQCVKLNWALFKRAFIYAESKGFRTTASVFDKGSLDYLFTFDIPFVKIANRKSLRYLGRDVPRGMPIVWSYDDAGSLLLGDQDHIMACVSDYPAKVTTYERWFTEGELAVGISDHTVGLELWHRYRPLVYEKHFKLLESTGPDAGPWAATATDLEEVFDG